MEGNMLIFIEIKHRLNPKLYSEPECIQQNVKMHRKPLIRS
jgi:Holliday junction resolvase